MYDAAAGGHPHDVARAQRSFFTVAQLAFHDERHRLESSVRMRRAGLATRLKIDPIIHQQNEWIVARKIPGVEDGDGGVSSPNESR